MFKTTLCGVLLISSIFLQSLAARSQQTSSNNLEKTQYPEGQSYLKQSSSLTSISSLSPPEQYEYAANFDDSWHSLRTFHLMTSLAKPLKIFIDTRMAHQGLPTKVGLYQPQYQEYVLKALKAWSNALDGRLTYLLTPSRKDADITIDWVSHFDDPSVAGMTAYKVGHAAVEIKITDIPETDIACNIMHEFGHALGISGHSPYRGDVMVATRQWHRSKIPFEPKLSVHDIEAIRLLYSTAWLKGEDLYLKPVHQLPSQLEAFQSTAQSPVPVGAE